jgi:hypothetical protein
VPPDSYLEAALLIPDSVKKDIQLRVKQNANKIIEEQSFSYIWIKKGNDILPVRVKKGLTDGIYTEINGNVKEGDLVVTGLNSSAASTQASSSSGSSSSPFMPKMQQRPKK